VSITPGNRCSRGNRHLAGGSLRQIADGGETAGTHAEVTQASPSWLTTVPPLRIKS
jgi:hypothetical protein